MSSLTDTFQPGDKVAYRLRPITTKGRDARFSLGTVTIPPEIPENTLTFNGVPLVFNGAYVVFNPS